MFINIRILYLEQKKKLLMCVDNHFWLHNNELKQLQQILILARFHRLYLCKRLFLWFVAILFFQELAVLICSLYLFWKHFCFWVHLDKFGLFSQSFVFFDDRFKVILNVCNRIRTIRQIKSTIPNWSRSFKFIVVVFWLDVFPRVMNTQISQCYVFLRIFQIILVG